MNLLPGKVSMKWHILMFDSYFFIRIGQESLMEDNWPDDDIENELSPIAVQLAYVQQVELLNF